MFKNKSIPKTESINPQIDHYRLAALLNSLSDGVIAINAKGIIVLTNGAILNLLDKNSLIGCSVDESIVLLDGAGHQVQLSNLILSSRDGFNSDSLKLRFLDGSTINIFISATPVSEEFGDSSSGDFVVVLRDITKSKLIEEERNEFVSVAGHELRTPVAIAEGSISNAIMLAERSGATEPVMHTLQTAHNQVLFLSNMINDLAMLSRAERGKEALEIAEFNVVELVNLIANDYRPQASAKGLELQVQTDSKLSSLITSPLYVREILQNFITNSLKYTQSGFVNLNAVTADNGVLFTVTDTGIGISQAEQKKLFSKFFRSDDSRVKKEHGTGLGLYVSAKLINLLNGRLKMHSELNSGTSFEVYIPNQAK